jgi:hypothetical protein
VIGQTKNERVRQELRVMLYDISSLRDPEEILIPPTPKGASPNGPNGPCAQLPGPVYCTGRSILSMRGGREMRKIGILLLSLAVLFTPGAVMSGLAGPAGELVNTGLLGAFPSASGNIIAFTHSQYGVEIGYYDTATGSGTNTGLWTPDLVSVSGGIIAFWTAEWHLGEDLNGDGDVYDRVLSYYDVSTGTVTVTPASSNAINGDIPSFSGNIIAYHTTEYYAGDVNGDGDWADLAIMYYDLSTDTLTNAGVVGRWPAVSGNIIAFTTWEAAISKDLSGDGDWQDWVIRYYDISTGTVTNTGAQVDTWSSTERNAVSGSIIAFALRESWPGNVDQNGDGDTSDHVIMYYDISTGTTTNTGVVGYLPTASGNIIAFTSSEDQAGVDLNGDGDTEDGVIRYYDISTGTVTNTGAVGSWPSVSGNIIAFYTYELIGGEDLNGDGDEIDHVIMYFKIPEAPTIPTIGAISEQIDAFLDDGSIGNAGIAEAWHAFLQQAQAMMETGNAVAAESILNAFINSVQAQSQSGRHITAEAAQALIDSAQAVIDGL